MLSNGLLKLGELAIREDGTYAPFSGEAWLEALKMLVLGMGMIFAVLGILWGVLALFKVIFARPKKAKAKGEPEAVKSEETPVVVEETPVAVATSDDTELIAILTAAIVAYESEQGNEVSVGDFRVVSYRRANGGRSWNSK